MLWAETDNPIMLVVDGFRHACSDINGIHAAGDGDSICTRDASTASISQPTHQTTGRRRNELDSKIHNRKSSLVFVHPFRSLSTREVEQLHAEDGEDVDKRKTESLFNDPFKENRGKQVFYHRDITI